MKAVLDHVGIAVRHLEDALVFYRDALGLEIEGVEDVAEQRVRAQFLGTGQARLELLESSADDSAIARYIDKRGPGLHHITLRVDDIAAALAELAARDVRLVDRQPRNGAEGALVAFIHPSSAHGVLVELKQEARTPANLQVHQLPWGDLQLTFLHDGLFRLDGGAMFGVVPRPLWEKHTRPDSRNRIQMTMRPLLIDADWGRMLIDCGAGDKWSAKERDIYAFERERHLDHALADAAVDAASIDFALATHLHFDHFGGATTQRDGAIVPRFTGARYLIREAEWHDATHPHERNRASYRPDDFVPLKEHGVVDFYAADGQIKPGVRVVRTGGHTGQHQVVFIESRGQTAVFTADLIPTTAHIQDPWIMGYDLFPMETLAFKKSFIRQAIDREYLIVFEHDPSIAAGYIRERDGRRYVEPLR